MCYVCVPTEDGYVEWPGRGQSAFSYVANPDWLERRRLEIGLGLPLDFDTPYV